MVATTNKTELQLTLSECKEICKAHGFGKLLTNPAGNAKLIKSLAKGFYNVGLSLAPAKSSGFNVCQFAGICAVPCVAHTGRAEFFSSIAAARIARTKLFFQDRQTFLAIFRAELKAAERKAQRLGLQLAIRPNVFSDLPWHKIAPELFADFPAANWYGYTKSRSVASDFAAGRLPANYHITFSWSERIDVKTAKQIVRAGCNVAVPFYHAIDRKGCLPTSMNWQGLPVLDGDKTDLRFLDPAGHIVGLRAKLPKNRAKALKTIQASKPFFVPVID